MTLPDWTTAISTQITGFLAWGTVAAIVAAVVGVKVGSVVLSMFLSAFLKH